MPIDKYLIFRDVRFFPIMISVPKGTAFCPRWPKQNSVHYRRVSIKTKSGEIFTQQNNNDYTIKDSK